MTIPHDAIAARYPGPESKHAYVRSLFDRAAPHYDRVGAVGFLGTGHLYRRRALRRAGLRPGMDVLDVACGTGAVTRAIAEVLRGRGSVAGVDPSAGMLAQARRHVPARLCAGRAEALGLADASFDFVVMGYALRHVSDLETAFAEYRRVLRPGGRLLLLEISRPRTAAGLALARLYFRDVLPALARVVTGSKDARELMSYYWETIDACVPPQTILDALRRSGFVDAVRRTELSIFSAYTARAPER